MQPYLVYKIIRMLLALLQAMSFKQKLLFFLNIFLNSLNLLSCFFTIKK